MLWYDNGVRIIIKTTNLELTPALNEYIETKLWSLNKFVDKWDIEGAVEAKVEIGKTTKHHKKGNIYRTEVSLALPGKIIRAQREEWDIRVAIDRVKRKLQQEIKKHNDLQRDH
jgi:ribosomal subunit interface protein